MTDSTITYNEWDETPPEPLTQFDKIPDLTRWPAGAEDDGRLYRVAWCRSMKAITAGGERDYDKVVLDEDGTIQFEPLAPRHDTLSPSLENIVSGKTGSYVEMSKLSNALNARQDKMDVRAFTFYPDPVETVGAR